MEKFVSNVQDLLNRAENASGKILTNTKTSLAICNKRCLEFYSRFQVTFQSLVSKLVLIIFLLQVQNKTNFEFLWFSTSVCHFSFV